MTDASLAGLPAMWAWRAAASLWMAGVLATVARRQGLGPWPCALVGVAPVVELYVGSRAHYLLANLATAPHPTGAWDLVFGSGVHVPGGMLLAAVAAWLCCRATGLGAAAFADRTLPALALGFVLIRLGCFAEGCCFGSPTDLPWGVHFPQGTAPYWFHSARGWLPDDAAHSRAIHPTQLYFAAVWLVVAAVALAWRRRSARDGDAFLAGLAAWGIGQVIVESLRDAEYLRGTPYLAECGWAAVAVAGAAWLVRVVTAPAAATAPCAETPRTAAAARSRA